MADKQFMRIVRDILSASQSIKEKKLNDLIQAYIVVNITHLYNKYPEFIEKIISNHENEIKVYDHHIKRMILKYRFNYDNPCVDHRKCKSESFGCRQEIKLNSEKSTSVSGGKYCLNSLIKINYTFTNIGGVIEYLDLQDCHKRKNNTDLYYTKGIYFLKKVESNLLFKSYACPNKLCRNPDTVFGKKSFLYTYNQKNNMIELIFDSKHPIECKTCHSTLQEIFEKRRIEDVCFFRLSDESYTLECICAQKLMYKNQDRIGIVGYFTRNMKGYLVFCVIKSWKIKKRIRLIKFSSIESAAKSIFKNAKKSTKKHDWLIVAVLSMMLCNDFKMLIYTYDTLNFYRLAYTFFRYFNKKVCIFFTNNISSAGVYINSILDYKGKISSEASFMFILNEDCCCYFDYKYESNSVKRLSQNIENKVSYLFDNEQSCCNKSMTNSNSSDCTLLKSINEELHAKIQVVSLRIYIKNNEKINTSKIIYIMCNLVAGLKHIIDREISNEDLITLEKLITDKLV